jgi:membrane-associated protein
VQETWEFLKQLVNPESIIVHGGLFLLLFVVFAETGLFIGFFLPGDSLLFTAGLLCATGVLDISIEILVLLISLAAIIGNMVGFVFGQRVGALLYKRKSDFFFKLEHLITARDFYNKHGGLALILCRFLPIVRTFAPIVAGIVKLEFRKFLAYSMIGGVAWVCLLTLSGYFLVKIIPNLKDYLGYIVIFLIAITSLPFIASAINKRRIKMNERSQRTGDDGREKADDASL